MINTELADKILEVLYSTNGVIGSADLARKVGYGQDEVLKTIHEVRKHEELYILIKTGYGDSEITVNRNQHKEEQVKLFLHAGGFTAISKNNEAENESLSERNRLELEHLKLEITSLQRLPSEQKHTRMLSWIAIGISLLTVLFEIYKYYHEKT
jgi:hypothetical protein